MHQYLARKINYPAEASQRNLSGTVYVRFVVDEQGRIRDAEVAKGCGHGFDEEALRVVRLMPWWAPGRVAGQPVRVLRTLPIVFRLSR
nr:energy transducer TonB [Hymenobacter ruricola]